jgi:hypothetical protein
MTLASDGLKLGVIRKVIHEPWRKITSIDVVGSDEVEGLLADARYANAGPLAQKWNERKPQTFVVVRGKFGEFIFRPTKGSVDEIREKLATWYGPAGARTMISATLRPASVVPKQKQDSLPLSRRVSKSEYQELARREFAAQREGVSVDEEQLLADIRSEARKAEQTRKAEAEAKAAKKEAAQEKAKGINPAMVCPHCGERGKVGTHIVRAKKGISGGKATGALLTGGLSILATGLSRKETLTRAHCYNCSNTWVF